MKQFPTHPIELNNMFKETGFYVLYPEMEPMLFMIKIHVSKIKKSSDLQNAYSKIEKCAFKNGFTTKLKSVISNFTDFRFHGSYYNIYFYVQQ